MSMSLFCQLKSSQPKPAQVSTAHISFSLFSLSSFFFLCFICLSWIRLARVVHKTAEQNCTATSIEREPYRALASANVSLSLSFLSHSSHLPFPSELSTIAGVGLPAAVAVVAVHQLLIALTCLTEKKGKRGKTTTTTTALALAAQLGGISSHLALLSLSSCMLVCINTPTLYFSFLPLSFQQAIMISDSAVFPFFSLCSISEATPILS